MSRCFPHPPPGYDNIKALIESIKLQKEREKAKKERRKEKKREKKEKKLRGGKGKMEDRKLSHKKRRHDEIRKLNYKGGDFSKAREDETEQLEKSSLTEEHGPPSDVPNSCDSSDSSQNSSKRKKLEWATDVSHNHYGNGLRIRCLLLKHKEVPSTPSEEPCFSGRAKTNPAKGKSSFLEDIRSDIMNSGCNCKKEKLFKDLIVDWNFPPMQMGNSDSDDQDWLFGPKRKHHGQGGRRQLVSSEGSSRASGVCSWPPRACYLPEGGIFALPHVVPY